MGIDLPASLGPAESPGDFGQASSSSHIATKSIMLEDAIARQIDRIAYLRSSRLPWDEAVFQLRDMCVGLEDGEFYDGIPDQYRVQMEGLAPSESDELKEKYAEEGWNGCHFRAYRVKGGGVVYKPTEDQMSTALRIIMRLLSRHGVTWRSRRVSVLGPWPGVVSDESEEGVEGEEDGVPEEGYEDGAQE